MFIVKRILFPLGGEGNDALERISKGAEIYLRQGQNFWRIAPQRNVELPPGDELFCQRSLPITLHYVGHPCSQGGWSVGYGLRTNPQAGILRHWLDDEREGKRGDVGLRHVGRIIKDSPGWGWHACLSK
jgi:hypothetical protein